MPRFSHDDPAYRAALKEMARNINRLMDDRGWNQADLVRHAKIHMPPEARFGADNASNFAGGKRKPTKPFIAAMCKAFGVEETDFMPPYLAGRVGTSPPVSPLLTAVAGKPGMYRVYIDRELPLKEALRVVEGLEGGKDAS